MSEPQALDVHLFVCTNRKERGDCCAARGGGELRDAAKTLAAQTPEWKGRVRVNASGCLGHCERGIAAVVYPQARWFTELSSTDAPRLVEAIREAIEERSGG